jgi:two-component sensor histidine kinase
MMPKPQSQPALTATQLLSLSAVLALLPGVVFGIYAMFSLIGRDQQAQRERLVQTARSLVMTVDQELGSLRRIAETEADAPTLKGGNIAAFAAEATIVSRIMGASILVLDESGQQLLNTRSAGGPLPRTGNFETLERTIAADGSPVLTVVKTTSDGALAVTATRSTTASSGEKLVVAVTENLDRLARIFDRTPIPPGWLAAVDAPDGSIIARSQSPELFIGKKARLTTAGGGSGLTSFTDLEGRPSLLAFAVSPETGFRVVVWAPESVFYASSSELKRWFGGLAAVVIIVTVLAAIVTGNVIRIPIRQVAESAKSLGHGRPVTFAPSFMQEANIAGEAMVVAARTIAERERDLREESDTVRLLLRELAHRSKNIMSVVSAVARRTARTTSSPDDFLNRFEGRLQGLSSSIDLLTNENWRPVTLSNLLDAQLQSFAGLGRYRFSGVDVPLSPKATQRLGMAIHELATNATKYGALSVPDGQVDIVSHVDGDQWSFTWQELNGPPIPECAPKGFGRQLLEGILAEFGRFQFELLPGGIKCQLKADLKSVAQA